MKNKRIASIIEYIINALTSFREVDKKSRKTILKYYIKTPIYAMRFLNGKKYTRELNSDVMIKNNNEVFFCGRNMSNVIGLSSANERDVKSFLTLKKGDFIDVGANCGKYTVSVGKKLKGKVLAIEPEKYNFMILEKNISLNKMKNVIAINMGCFSKKSVLKLYMDDVGTGGHSIIKKHSGKYKKINVDTIDNMVTSSNLNNIKLIKIDAEGAEFDIILGAKNTLKKYHPKIVIESWSINKIYKILLQMKYRMKKINEENYFFE